MNPKPQASTAVFEQVYTSASALLDRAHGDLGVVCETVGFPREIQPDLDRLNSYQPLEDASSKSPDKHPPAYTLSPRGTQGKFYSISRTVFAGADHTGRTNPLVHHFVLSTEAVPAGSTPADLLLSLRSLFLFRWNSEPQRMEHPRELKILKRLESESIFPSAAWLRLASAKRVAEIFGFFAEHMTSTAVSTDISVVFVIPSTLGDDVCDMLSDLLALLPAYAAFSISARTHVLSPPSITGQCRVMFTYANTPFLIQTRRRQDGVRPVIIDLVGGESTPLQCRDYGELIERSLCGNCMTHDIKTLVDLRSLMSVVQELGGTPFADFVTLNQYITSLDPMQNVDAILPLLDNVTRASKAAEVVVASLLAKGIVSHFNARKGESDWHALTTLGFSGPVPDKPRQLAIQAIEKCLPQALPFVLGHPLLCKGSPGKLQRWLQECVEREGAVSTLLQHSLRYPTPQNLGCIRTTLLDLRPRVTQDSLYAWGNILHAAQGSAVQSLCSVVAEFVAIKAEAHELTPKALMRSIPQIIDKCEKSEQHAILFRLIEAVATTNQLEEFVRSVATTYGSDGKFITDYDISRHSRRVRAAINQLQGPPTLQDHRPRQIPQSGDTYSKQLDPHRKPAMSSRSNIPEVNGANRVKTLKSACWWMLAAFTGIIAAAFLIFVLEFTEWWPTLRWPKREPTIIQWLGLLAFPLSALFSGVMLLLVVLNKDPTRLNRSGRFLMAALVAMVAGIASTLYAGFEWLH